MKKYISVLLLVLMTLVPFSGFAGDIDPDFQDAINLCQALGIIQNYEDGTFRPDNKVTRAEFSTILIRLLSLEQAAEAIDEPSKFNDVADNHWAKKQINLLYTLGYINGVGNGQFMPDGNAVFNTCLQFGGAAGTALFSTILSVAQAGSGEEGSDAFRHATAVGGSWTFAMMIAIVSIAICCLIAAFRIGAKRK